MLAHLPRDSMLAALDQLVDELVNVRTAELLDRRFGPTGQGMAPQHSVDVSPGADVWDDLDFHESGEYGLERVHRPDQVALATLDPQVATFCGGLDDLPRMATRSGQLKGRGAAQGDLVLLPGEQSACGAGTYLYIDKSMQDHGLFQAICRTNRLDGEDKDFGYIVDYKDLFKKVENAIAVYTSELDHSSGGAEPEVLLQDRLKKGKERLDHALEAITLTCEPVEPPHGELQYIHYFCGNTEIATDLEEREPQRAALYKATAALVRAYAGIADELEQAGYSTVDISSIKKQIAYYVNVREIIRKASGETIDLKAYEADMRHLIDTYIQADEPRKISLFDDMSLVELIVKTGIADAIANRLGSLKGNKDAIAETIENNVRSKIIKEHLNDPAYYDKISTLLDEVIANRRAKAIEYEDYLKRVAEIAKQAEAGHADDTPGALDTPGKRALYNNLGRNEELALRIDEAVKTKRSDAWRGVQPREQQIKRALYDILKNADEVERIFVIIKAQKEY